MPTKSHLIRTKHSPITQEITRVLGALCQELGAETKYLFLSFFFFFKTLWIFFFFWLFIYLFMAVLGLRFCARAFSSCGERGPLFIAVCGLSLSRPLLLQSTSSRRACSVVVAHGPSCSAACGIFPDQGSNLCPLQIGRASWRERV